MPEWEKLTGFRTPLPAEMTKTFPLERPQRDRLVDGDIVAHVVGKPFDEETVMRVADAFEMATPWRGKRPEIG